MSEWDTLWLNGAPAEVAPLAAALADNYGHFTVLPVVEGRARGLGLHLARLDQASVRLFGCGLDAGRIRAYLRKALDGMRGERVVRIHVFSRSFDRERPGAVVLPDVLILVRAARPRSSAPLAVKTYRHCRVLPTVKHVGTFALFHYRRRAQAAGFDDALFVDPAGRITEGSVWNLVLFDGERFVWPATRHLPGIAMQLLQAGLARLGCRSEQRAVQRGELADFRAAFFCNAVQPVRTIARIDEVRFPGDAAAAATLAAAYATHPWEEP